MFEKLNEVKVLRDPIHGYIQMCIRDSILPIISRMSSFWT